LPGRASQISNGDDAKTSASAAISFGAAMIAHLQEVFGDDLDFDVEADVA
jgi:hypothetical protein